MEKILVTGGLGFIGSHIAEHFCKSGFSVTIIDNSENKVNLSGFEKEVETVSASILDYEKVRQAAKDARFVFHEAAFVSVPQSMENPALAQKINVQGTLNVLKAAQENGAKRAILASSSAIYGNNIPPLYENMKPEPLSPYAETKLENERQAREFCESGLETISLRYFNVYGPRQDQNSTYAAAIPRFITLLKSGKQPVIYGDGNQTRDFIYVKDVVTANMLAARADKSALGESFNVASGTRTPILSLLEKIGKLCKIKPDPVFQPARNGDILHSYADVSKAALQLHFNAQYTLDQGLKETVKSF